MAIPQNGVVRESAAAQNMRARVLAYQKATHAWQIAAFNALLRGTATRKARLAARKKGG